MSTISDFLPSIANNSFQSSSSSCITTPHDKRDRQLNYNKTLVSSVYHIECRCLYRVLMKIEIPFRGIAMKNLRHRFIKLLYENACKVEPDYTKLIHFVKVHIGLCISLPDTRQLVLYSSLFGVTENFCAPNAEDTLRVIKSCPLAVPPFINFKKWSRDVKRMEGNPLSADVTKGFFANNHQSGNSECVSIMSLREDFKEFDDNGSSRTSSDSDDDFTDTNNDCDEDDLSDHKDNVEYTFPPNFALTGKSDLKSVMVNKTKSLMLLSRLFDDEEVAESGARLRKKGKFNLYERSDNHELNKMILALSRGNKEYIEPEEDLMVSSELIHRFSKVFIQNNDAPPPLVRFDSIKESDNDDDDDDDDVEDGDDADGNNAVEEQQAAQAALEERKKVERLEQELVSKKKKRTIAKLTQRVSLRPSLAKMNMIKKLRNKREMVISESPSQSCSRKPSVENEKEDAEPEFRRIQQS